MKALLTVTALCLTVFLMGCQNGESMATPETSPGAVAEPGSKCGPDCTKPCCAEKTGECCGTCGGEKPSPGAVGEKDCGACPMSGEAAPGAMGEKDCSGCPSKSSPALGAVGEKDCGPCPASGCSAK